MPDHIQTHHVHAWEDKAIFRGTQILKQCSACSGWAVVVEPNLNSQSPISSVERLDAMLTFFSDVANGREIRQLKILLPLKEEANA